MKLQIECLNAQSEKFSTDVEFAPVSVEAGDVSYARVVRGLLNHLRQATSATKTRGEVSLSGKKPWKQKGTGRARVSSAKSPLWRKGGIIFGPQPGCTRLKINKQERIAVLGQLIKNRLEAGDFFGLELPQNLNVLQTSVVAKLLKNAGFNKEQRVLFLLASDDIVTFKAIRNIANVEVNFYDQLGVLEMSRKGKVVFLVKDKEQMVEAFGQWM
jgi:large subunit ribosomal protein L4